MKNIWADDEGFELEKLTAADVRKVEDHFNVQLPKEYIKLLKMKNGGYLTKQSLPVRFKNSWADDHIPIEFLFGIKRNEGIWESKELLMEWGIKEDNFITISGDGHTWIVLDYRKNKKEPQITFIDIEYRKIKVIFNSFKEMIENLYEHEEDDSEEFNLLDNPNTLSKAKELLNSKDPADISRGILTWAASYEDMEGLANTLVNFLENQKNENIRMNTAGLFSDLVGNKTIKDQTLINKALTLMKNDDKLLMYYELALEYLDENKI